MSTSKAYTDQNYQTFEKTEPEKKVVKKRSKQLKSQKNHNQGWTSQGLIHWVSLTEDHAVKHLPSEHDDLHNTQHLREFVHVSSGNPSTGAYALAEGDSPPEEESKGVSITEIFFDLVFVAAVSALGGSLKADELTFENYFQYFLVIWFFWKETALYGSLLASDDLWHKFYFGAVGCGIISLAIHCQGGWEDETNSTRFAMTGAYMSFLLCVAFFRAIWHMKSANRPPPLPHMLPREKIARHYLRFRAVFLVIIGILWVVAIYIKGPYRRWMFWAAFLAFPISECLQAILIDRKKQLHPDIQHFNERMESFTLIVLGETMVNIAQSPPEGIYQEVYYLTVLFGFLSLFLIKVYHYDVEEYHPEIHALGRSYWNKLSWMYSSCFEGIGVALLGEGVGQLITSAVNGEDSIPGQDRNHWMLSIGLFLNLAFGLGSRLSHAADIEDFDYAMVLWYSQQCTQGLLSMIVLFAPLYIGDDLPIYAPLAYICVVMVIINVLGLLDEIFEIREREKLLKKEAALYQKIA